jgi:hypothetical protein
MYHWFHVPAWGAAGWQHLQQDVPTAGRLPQPLKLVALTQQQAGLAENTATIAVVTVVLEDSPNLGFIHLLGLLLIGSLFSMPCLLLLLLGGWVPHASRWYLNVLLA